MTNTQDSRKAYKAEWYKNNKERLAEQAAERYKKARADILAKAKEKYKAEREMVLAVAKARYAALPDHKRQQKILAANLRDKANPEQARARAALRRKRNQRATPSWLTREDRRKIKLFYAQAMRLTEETGIEHHVDHIVPLQGGSVCGLHVPWNLQVITAAENIKKANKTWPDKP